MAQRVISGAHLKVYINGAILQEVQSLSYSIEYGEEPIYGIDSVFPQEIKITKISVTGNISGVRVANSNGLQGQNIRSGIKNSVFAPYISIRIHDNRTGEDIMFIPHAKVVEEKLNVSTKGTVRTSFSFTGLQPQQPLDR
jgi:hypothetical protein